MKYNLKNFPVKFYSKTLETEMYPTLQVNLWVEGFEVELREKLAELQEAYDSLPIPSIAGPKIRVKMIQIKEILGDQP